MVLCQSRFDLLLSTSPVLKSLHHLGCQSYSREQDGALALELTKVKGHDDRKELFGVILKDCPVIISKKVGRQVVGIWNVYKEVLNDLNNDLIYSISNVGNTLRDRLYKSLTTVKLCHIDGESIVLATMLRKLNVQEMSFEVLYDLLLTASFKGKQCLFKYPELVDLRNKMKTLIEEEKQSKMEIDSAIE